MTLPGRPGASGTDAAGHQPCTRRLRRAAAALAAAGPAAGPRTAATPLAAFLCRAGALPWPRNPSLPPCSGAPVNVTHSAGERRRRARLASCCPAECQPSGRPGASGTDAAGHQPRIRRLRRAAAALAAAEAAPHGRRTAATPLAACRGHTARACRRTPGRGAICRHACWRLGSCGLMPSARLGLAAETTWPHAGLPRRLCSAWVRSWGQS